MRAVVRFNNFTTSSEFALQGGGTARSGVPHPLKTAKGGAASVGVTQMVGQRPESASGFDAGGCGCTPGGCTPINGFDPSDYEHPREDAE